MFKSNKYKQLSIAYSDPEMTKSMWQATGLQKEQVADQERQEYEIT